MSVDRARGREDNALDIIFGHELEEVNQRDEVVTIVFERFFHRFAHGLRGGKMNNALDAGIFFEHAFERREITAIHLFESRTRAADFFDAVDDFGF